MTVAPSAARESTAQPSAPPFSTSQLIVWLALQLLVLVLAAARVPLAAKYPEPPEQLAPHLLLCAQAIAASLLFPWLLRDVRLVIQVVASALPFQLASAYLAGLSASEVVSAITYVDSVVLVLAIWAPLLKSFRAQGLGVACASCLTLGAGMLRYFRLEFTVESNGSHQGWETATPLPSTVHALAGQPVAASWMVLGVFAVIGMAVYVFKRSGRQVFHKVVHRRRESEASINAR